MSMPEAQLNQHLKAKARWVWRETLKVHRRSPETRVASSLSPVEVFIALYYGGVLRFDPQNPRDEQRDRCIISKGHGSICMYPILADLGFFPMAELERVCEAGSFLGGIPDPVIPGYETVNGSLGHGMGVGAGMALGLKRKNSDRSVFVVTGDGELHEGANWEAFMFASHHGLDNLHLIVDDNQISMLGGTDNIVSHGSLSDRLEAFGWDCYEVNGHDVISIRETLMHMKSQSEGRPKALIARTKKGHGVPTLEGAELSHVMSLKPELIDALLEATP
jgi:transketolase|tara:strand:- start:2951 stop:3781 length:831 start_codon:yes stop_codon:yes gene_type:complete